MITGLLIAITVAVWLHLLVFLSTISRVGKAALTVRNALVQAQAVQQAQQVNTP